MLLVRVLTRTTAFLFVLLLFAAAPSKAAEQDAGGVAYSVDIRGEPSGDVTELIKRASQLLALRNRPPPSLAALGRRIHDDEDRVRAILESEGYYDADVTSRIEEGEEPKAGAREQVAVIVSIVAGPRYVLRRLLLDIGARSGDTSLPVLRGKSYLKPAEGLAGRPARAAVIIAAEDAALAALRVGGFAFARRGDRDVEVDREAHAIDVTLPVKLGPDVVFGDVHVLGDTDVNSSYVTNLVSWKPGARYDATRLETLRTTLVTAGIYASVLVEPAGSEDMPNGAPLDINVTVQDALHRTFAAGAKYARDKGAGASLLWEHRNILGGGEKLSVTLNGTQIDQTALMTFSKPGFWAPTQTLKLAIDLHHQDTDAYREWGAINTAALERRLNDFWVVSGGVSLDLAKIEDAGVKRRSYLAGLPVTATWTTTDPLTPLDPTRGWRVSAAVTPYGGSFDGTVFFLKSEAQASVYMPVDGVRTVFAARLKAGSIVGAETGNIPANRRFYGGGGGSIRGYAYQLVSPLAADNSPTGGRSLLEGSLEARYRITNTIGIVPFFDTGMASASSIPGVDGALRAAAGLGLRYYTPVGPLRVDVAMPLNRRPGVDKGFQFYISFGQAF